MHQCRLWAKWEYTWNTTGWFHNISILRQEGSHYLGFVLLQIWQAVVVYARSFGHCVWLCFFVLTIISGGRFRGLCVCANVFEVCTVCIWRCEHAVILCGSFFMRHTSIFIHSFIHSFIQHLASFMILFSEVIELTICDKKTWNMLSLEHHV